MCVESSSVVRLFSEFDSSSETNKVLAVVDLLGIEERGYYKGESHVIVLGKTSRTNNKDLYVWVLFKDGEKIRELIKEDKLVFIEGKMDTYVDFNEKALTHTFIVPEKISLLEGDVEYEMSEEFYLSYTLNNRVVIEGVIDRAPWREFIPPVNNYVTRFSIRFDDGVRKSVYCTVWDTVNNIDELKEGMKVRVVGSFNLLKKERGLVVEDGAVVRSRKNKLDSYVIVVQKLDELVNEEVSKEAKEEHTIERDEEI